MKSTTKAEHREKAAKILKGAGYGAMKKDLPGNVGQHEFHNPVKEVEGMKMLATGGCASGGKPRPRMDRKPRAAGGRNKHSKTPHVAVNVINAGKTPVPMPMPAGGMAAKPPVMPPPQAAPMPPHPMMPPQGGPPMPPPGGMPQRPFKAGGPVKNKMDMPHLQGGAGGALGRLEKSEHEAKRKKTA